MGMSYKKGYKAIGVFFPSFNSVMMLCDRIFMERGNILLTPNSKKVAHDRPRC